MATQGLPGIPLAAMAAGGVLVWSGINNVTVTETLTSLLHGVKPTPGPKEQLIASSSPAAASTASTGGAGGLFGTIASGARGAAIASDALKYVGSEYVWGGAPGTTVGTDDGTDCSGFVNMVIGRDLKLAIPGYPAGQYTGASHGPTSQIWLLWGGAKSIPRSQAEAGDLACWLTHIGIFTDAGQTVVSSLDAESGVVVTSVAGATPMGEPLICRRLNG